MTKASDWCVIFKDHAIEPAEVCMPDVDAEGLMADRMIDAAAKLIEAYRPADRDVWEYKAAMVELIAECTGATPDAVRTIIDARRGGRT